jgi:hypothetical protein
MDSHSATLVRILSLPIEQRLTNTSSFRAHSDMDLCCFADKEARGRTAAELVEILGAIIAEGKLPAAL